MAKWSLEEVTAKVDWEGGVYSALQWGLKSSDIADEELSPLWAKIEEVLPIFDRIEEILSVVTIPDELL